MQVENTSFLAQEVPGISDISWDMGILDPSLESPEWILGSFDMRVFVGEPIPETETETEADTLFLKADWPQRSSLQNDRLIMLLKAEQQTDEANRWPGAKWPSKEAFRDAFEFIDLLPLSEVTAPDITLADDGEINFFWKARDIHVDLGLYGTGTFSYFAKKDDGRKVYGEKIPVNEGLPDDLKALLAT